MPGIYAHMLFAKKVVSQSDIDIPADSPAVLLGSFGPDPLFNDPMPMRNRQALAVHRSSGTEVLERFRDPIRMKVPSAEEYAVGFFTHYALDRICHPDIKRRAATGSATHYAIESQCEQILIASGKSVPVSSDTFTMEDYAAACIPYNGISARSFRRDTKNYLAFHRFTNRNAGKTLSRLPGLFYHRLDGLIPHSIPEPGEEEGAKAVLKTMEASIELTAEHVHKLVDAFRNDRPLDAWLQPDFSGK